MNKEAKNILEEIEDKKNKANSLGIPKTIFNLYSHIRYLAAGYFDSLAEHYKEKEETLPSIIGKIVAPDGRYGRTIQIEINGNSYSFDHEVRGENEYSLEEYLKLSKGKDIVLDLYMTSNKIIFIHGFIEGDWFKDFQQLDSWIKERTKEKEKERRKKELEEKKAKFGIK